MLLWLACFCSLHSFAQNTFLAGNLLVEHFSVKEGLAENLVTNVLQDRKGFLWMTSAYSLMRYDGYTFKTWQLSSERTGFPIFHAHSPMLEDGLGRIWFRGGPALLVFDPKTERFSHVDIPFEQSYLLRKDNLGNIWVLPDGDLTRISAVESQPDSFALIPFPFTEPIFKERISDFIFDETGNLWLSLTGGEIWRIPVAVEKKELKLQYSKAEKIKNATADPSFYYRFVFNRFKEELCAVGFEGTFYNCIIRELGRYDKKQNAFSSIKVSEGFEQVFNYRALEFDGRGNLWIADWGNGVFRITDFGSQPKLERVLFDMPFMAEQNHTIAVDDNGHVWVGGRGGLHKICYKWDRFEVIKGFPDHEEHWLNYCVEDKQGKIWCREGGDGLARFNPADNSFQVYLQSKGAFGFPKEGNLKLFRSKNGTMWATSNLGLHKFDSTSNAFPLVARVELKEKNMSARMIAEDPAGNIWFTYDGAWEVNSCYLFEPETSQLHPVIVHDFEKRDTFVPLFLYFDEQGGIWQNTWFGGINQLHRLAGKPGELVLEQRFLENYDQLNNVWIHNPEELWLSSYSHGLVRLHPKTKEFKEFSAGAATHFVGELLPDSLGRLWMRSQGGLGLFDLETESLHFLQESKVVESLFPNGMGSREFLKTQNGEWYIGMKNGLVRFLPESFVPDSIAPKVVFTNFLLGNQPISFGKDSLIPLPVPYITTITLKHFQNAFAIEYASLQYVHPAANQYAYRLDGVNDDWIYVGQERIARFSDLSPGRYVFHVKAANGDGVWNEEGASLEIVILPPWWRTWWAWLIWITLAAGGLYAFYRFQLRRKLEQAEARRLKEMDAVKSRLYTNITHEFRTPLTVVLGNLEIMKLEIEKQAQQFSFAQFLISKISIAKRNAQNLLQLINQLLDLSKLESGKLTLHPVQGDVVLFLKYLLESFQSLAAAKSISLYFHSAMDSFIMDYDEERLRQIASNLLSNAIKFTPEGGSVDLRLTIDELRLEGANVNRNSSIVIQVKDTGAGIPSDKLPFIFDRFYQADDSAIRHAEGTGIGLALTKELVKLLGGTIEVKSELGKGTEFAVTLPVTRTADLRFKNDDLRLEEPEMILKSEAAPPFVNRKSEIVNEKPLVLVVEDNPDVQAYLAGCLEEKYQVELSNDGREGIERAIELVPDLVISDVMMPGADGYELCRALKNDERTSHIPIVMLTAKADIESKIEGLEHGADAYLAKPFHQKELFVRLEKLLELRKTLQARYGSSHPSANTEFPLTEQVIPHSSSLIPDREEAFLQKVRLVIESRLSDEDYDVVQLSRELGMSRSQLFRKMKALTDKSIAAFIRSYRLHRAKQLLESTDLNVSEIAYNVGYKDPSYFTKTFLEEFGVLPSSFRH